MQVTRPLPTTLSTRLPRAHELRRILTPDMRNRPVHGRPLPAITRRTRGTPPRRRLPHMLLTPHGRPNRMPTTPVRSQRPRGHQSYRVW